MNMDCKGIIGRYFGHKFKSFLIKERYINRGEFSLEITGNENALKFIDTLRDKYEIRCKRCGLKINDDK